MSEFLYPSMQAQMNEAEYRAVDAINYSTVKSAIHRHKTPAHYYAYELAEDKPNKKQDDSMVLGSATHILVLQKERFNSLYMQSESSDKRTKTYKQDVVENPGKTVLTPKSWDEVHLMAASVLSHPAASFLLSVGVPEVPIFWKDPASEEPCKACVDWLRPDHHLVDLKTTHDASLNHNGFDYIVRYQQKYSWQLAHYMNGYKEITGIEPTWTFIAVENTFPFLTHVLSYSPELIAKFKAEWRNALDKYIHARDNNWPGYSLYIEEVC